MDSYNLEYLENVDSIKKADNIFAIEKSIKSLTNLRNKITIDHPEYFDSIIDIDYQLARGAFRINNPDLFEETVQKHYYYDFRFKKLYQLFRDMQTANVWNNIAAMNASKLEKTFIRSLSLVILTGVCISLLLRK